MAGGAGVRLWPMSRRTRPKQTLRLFEGKSLLRRSYERIVGLLPSEQIHVITTKENLPVVAEEVPEIPSANLIGEPVGRDTANTTPMPLSPSAFARPGPTRITGTSSAASASPTVFTQSRSSRKNRASPPP
jgi:mannose-1-phosphate guanylyltransferase